VGPREDDAAGVVNSGRITIETLRRFQQIGLQRVFQFLVAAFEQEGPFRFCGNSPFLRRWHFMEPAEDKDGAMEDQIAEHHPKRAGPQSHDGAALWWRRY
jgi:hypothetical protein